MGKDSAITWCHHTFNPWWGCWKISPGCKHCYADAFDHRLGGKHWGADAPRRDFGDDHWNAPRKWNASAAKRGVRERVFCASMADVFEDRRDRDEHRGRLWRLIGETRHLDWLLLTKRPESFATMLPWLDEPGAAGVNVWGGVTVEDADHAWRAEVLGRAQFAVRFVSYEPALGPLDVDGSDFNGIHWLVCGDESGKVRRPAQADWFRIVRDQCEARGIAFHLKQWAGAATPGIEGPRTGGKIHLPVLDGRIHDAFPEAH